MTDEATLDDFEGEDGYVELVDRVARGLRFMGREFEHARLVRVTFDECDLSGVRFEDTSMQHVVMRGCRLSGLQAIELRAKDLLVVGARGEGINLRASKIDHSAFIECDFTELDLGAATLTDVDFIRCTLLNADVHRSKLTRVALHGSAIDGLVNVGTTQQFVIATDQVVPMAYAAFRTLGIKVDDDYEGPASKLHAYP